MHAHATAHTKNIKRRAKNSMPCLIKEASRYAVDRISKATTFLSLTFYKIQRSYEKILYLLYHWFSGENGIMFTFSLHKGQQTSTN